MQEESTHPAMKTLKRWKTEGKIDLVEAIRPRAEREAAYGWPGSPPRVPPPKRLRRSPWSPQSKESNGGVTFRSVSSILYPAKDSQKLELGEMNNVAHLMKHHERKNEFFVTYNKKDFIEGGKQERLRTNFGIVVVTPDEAVETLTSLESWK